LQQSNGSRQPGVSSQQLQQVLSSAAARTAQQQQQQLLLPVHTVTVTRTYSCVSPHTQTLRIPQRLSTAHLQQQAAVSTHSSGKSSHQQHQQGDQPSQRASGSRPVLLLPALLQ
jgi:hypothetical protein